MSGSIRQRAEIIRDEADTARFLYATLDPADAIRIMDDCLARIQVAADDTITDLNNAELIPPDRLIYDGETYRLIPDPPVASLVRVARK